MESDPEQLLEAEAALFRGAVLRGLLNLPRLAVVLAALDQKLVVLQPVTIV